MSSDILNIIIVIFRNKAVADSLLMYVSIVFGLNLTIMPLILEEIIKYEKNITERLILEQLACIIIRAMYLFIISIILGFVWEVLLTVVPYTYTSSSSTFSLIVFGAIDLICTFLATLYQIKGIYKLFTFAITSE